MMHPANRIMAPGCALRIADRLNRRPGRDRGSQTAFAERRLRGVHR